MEEKETYIIGDKEYTREQLIRFGKEHYPKFYWIPRGIGIGFMVIGGILFLAYSPMIFSEYAVYLVGLDIFLFFIFMAGLISFFVSYNPLPEEKYFKHAVDYLNKQDLNMKIRASKIQKRDERYAEKENSHNVDQLLKYKKLLDEGVITQEEFDQKKKELL